MQAHTCQHCSLIHIKLPKRSNRQDDWIYEWPLSQSVDEARRAAADGCSLFKLIVGLDGQDGTDPALRIIFRGSQEQLYAANFAYREARSPFFDLSTCIGQ